MKKLAEMLSAARMTSALSMALLLTASVYAQPYPGSDVITGLEWDSDYFQYAEGSDNWPCTWADDDMVYGACGDGNGFGGERASMWICRLAGMAPSISGENVKLLSEYNEGKKGSGILSVDGILYVYVRNAVDNYVKSQIAWSADHGANWTWESWMWDEFGYCGFVNYGRDYAGARDGFVYVASHDNNSAYVQSDQFILMRVPKDKIRDKTAYEFFAGTNGGSATWTSDIAWRKPIFVNAGKCCRHGMSYNAALARYIWWQHNFANGADTRFSGGFGVYDAPEPWGPWTTVYYTELWDIGPGDAGNFPTKWMSADGKEMWLACGSGDFLTLRKCRLTIAQQTAAGATIFGVKTVKSSFADCPFSVTQNRSGFIFSARVPLVAQLFRADGARVFGFNIDKSGSVAWNGTEPGCAAYYLRYRTGEHYGCRMLTVAW